MAKRPSKFGIALTSLALFFFLYLESMLYYQAAIASYPQHQSFLFAQIPILAASAAGYLTFPLFVRKVRRAARRVLAVLFTVAGLCCIAVEYAEVSPDAAFLAGCLSFYLLGIAGGGSLWASSVALSRSSHVALWVAACHAAGIAAQTLLSKLPLTDFAETTLLAILIVAFVAFAMAAWPSMKSARRLANDTIDYSYYERKPFPYRSEARRRNPEAAPVRLAVIACVVIGLFSALFNLLFCAFPDDSTSIVQYTDAWSRIALIAGGLIMGALINIGNGKHVAPTIICVALIAASAIFATKTGANARLCQLIFFAGSGAFAVFYTMSTVWIAPFMKFPQLWAGMGRVVNSVVSIAVWLPAAAIAGQADSTATAIAMFLVLAAIVIAMNAAHPFLPQENEGVFVVEDLRVAKASEQTGGDALDATPRSKTSGKAGALAESEACTGAGAAPRADEGMRLGANVPSGAKTGARTGAMPEAETFADAKAALGSEADADAIPGMGTSAGAVSQPKAGASASAASPGPKTSAGAVPGTKTSAGADSISEPEAQAGSATGSAPAESATAKSAPEPLDPEEILEDFARKFDLTPRERNVLAAVVQDERPLKQVAADLDVTVRTVQRHLTSIYQKTGTQTRAGLAVCFYYAGKKRP